VPGDGFLLVSEATSSRLLPGASVLRGLRRLRDLRFRLGDIGSLSVSPLSKGFPVLCRCDLRLVGDVGSDLFLGGEYAPGPLLLGDLVSDTRRGGDLSSAFLLGGEYALDPRPRGDLSSGPRLGDDLGSNPRLGGDLGSNPRLGGDLGSNPRLGGDLGSNPRLGGDLGSNPRLVGDSGWDLLLLGEALLVGELAIGILRGGDISSFTSCDLLSRTLAPVCGCGRFPSFSDVERL